MEAQRDTLDQAIITRYAGQPARLPAELRRTLETAWGGEPVLLYAFADLSPRLALTECWVALGPTRVAVARAGAPGARRASAGCRPAACGHRAAARLPQALPARAVARHGRGDAHHAGEPGAALARGLRARPPGGPGARRPASGRACGPARLARG